MTSLGGRIKSLRAERGLQQRQLAEKAGMTPSMVSQIESGRLTPSLPTLGKLAAALGVPIASLFETARNGRLHVSRKSEYPVVSFDGTTEKWHVLGAGLFQGKIRAVVSTLGPRAKGVKTDKVVIDRTQNRHAAFGLGIHRCIGSNLARLEIKVALEEWLTQIPEFRLAQDARVTWSAGTVRGPRLLPLVFG